MSILADGSFAGMQITADTLLAYLRSELGVDADDVGPSTPLFSSGVIDSFALVQLLSYLEESCQIRFDAADIILDNLDSIDRILTLIERHAR